MADDFVVNVRQIYQYPRGIARLGDRLLFQQQSVGGPYLSVDPVDLVGQALQLGGWLRLAPGSGIAWNGAALTFGADGFAGFDLSEQLTVPSVIAEAVSVGGVAVATQDDIGILTTGLEDLAANCVLSFNGRTGNIALGMDDIIAAHGAPVMSPQFFGVVRAPTIGNPRACSDEVATTAFVQKAITNFVGCFHPFVFSFNGRTGFIELSVDDIVWAGGAPIKSPRFTGQPRVPTPWWGDNSTRIANTEWVDHAITVSEQVVTDAVKTYLQQFYAPLDSPLLTGLPQAPTAGPGTSTGQIATTAFVMNAVAESVAGVSSFNTRTGNVVFTAQDLSDVGGAFLASPIFTGTPSGPTATAGTSSTQLATTAFVQQALSAAPGGVSSFNTRTGAITLTLADVTNIGGAPINNTALTGTPTAPTPPIGDVSTRLATTAWVINEVGAIASGVTTFNGRSGVVALQAADISGAGGALLAGPTFTGIPSAPTAVPGTNTTQVATTAFVTAAMGAAQGVSSFNNRTGAVTLALADITAAGGAPLNNPVLTGAPAAPTASPGTATVQIATTAFVQAAIAGFLNSPAMTGIPTAPTATSGNNSTQVATTAFVTQALAALPTGGVSTFNGRAGAVTLTFGDVSAVGGAPLANPAFTGTPTAATAPPGTSTQQLATTAFVTAALGGGGVVSSFNGRVGTVTLSLADVTGTAVLNNTALTGTPTAPTAPASTNTTQVATTAFVESEILAKAGPSALTIKRTVFTATGTYTPSPGMVYADVEVLAGGGGGGGSYMAPTGSGTSWTAGGGGAGSYSKRLLTAAQIGASQAITIGAAGTAGPATGASVTVSNGGNGGNSSFGTLVTANGGRGGNNGYTIVTASVLGGAAGIGDIASPGQPGGAVAFALTSGEAVPGGWGASTLFGAGGSAHSYGDASGTGNPASGYGAGGGGAMSWPSVGVAAGAAGRPGLCVVTEYIQAGISGAMAPLMAEAQPRGADAGPYPQEPSPPEPPPEPEPEHAKRKPKRR